MKQEIAQFIQEACDIAGVESRLREDYSGRGMYGKTTYAIVGPSAQEILGAVIDYLIDAGDPSQLPAVVVNHDWHTGFYTDNMGYDIVMY